MTDKTSATLFAAGRDDHGLTGVRDQPEGPYVAGERLRVRVCGGVAAPSVVR